MNFDLSKKKLTDINKYLQNIDRKSNVRKFKIENPSGHHAICAGLKDDIDVTINGHTGYYCAGMNQKASVTVHGNVGTGVAENMMSGNVFVKEMLHNQLVLLVMVEILLLRVMRVQDVEFL